MKIRDILGEDTAADEHERTMHFVALGVARDRGIALQNPESMTSDQIIAAIQAHEKTVPPGAKPVRAKRPQGFKSGRMADFHRQVIQQGAEMLGADADDFDIGEVKDWVVHHRDLFKKGTVRIFRTIQVDPFWINALKPGTDVGQHWTWDLQPDEFIQFDMVLGHPDKPIYTIEADIDSSEVNFPLSVAYNILFPNERELFLMNNATPTVVAIRFYDQDEGVVDPENMRPDLVGKTLSI